MGAVVGGLVTGGAVAGGFVTGGLITGGVVVRGPVGPGAGSVGAGEIGGGALPVVPPFDGGEVPGAGDVVGIPEGCALLAGRTVVGGVAAGARGSSPLGVATKKVASP
jgi:hypothetical protein